MPPVLVIDSAHNWGGWFRAFVSDFRAAGWTVVDVEDTFDWHDLPGPTLCATHHAFSHGHLLHLPRHEHRLGAYVHSVGDFPFTAGFRPTDHLEISALAQYDDLFVATDTYKDWLGRRHNLQNVHKVGYPFNGKSIWAVGESDRLRHSVALAQRLDPDNNPWIAGAIIDRVGFTNRAYFQSAGVPESVVPMLDALHIERRVAPSHRHFLQMFGRYEWMVSASFNESFGRVFAEAVCLGVKVCAPRVPGLTELFEPDSLYTPFDIEEAANRILGGCPAVPRLPLRDMSSDEVIDRIKEALCASA